MSVATHADLKQLAGFSGPDAPDPDLLKACVHCGMCLSSCPTYRITGQELASPRGRLWLMSAVEEGRLGLDDPVFRDQMYLCLNCRACEAVCPSGVHYGPLLESSRQQLEQITHRGKKEQALRGATLGWLFSDMGRMRAMATMLKVYQRTGAQAVMRRSGMLRLLGMAEMERMTPRIEEKPLVPGKEQWHPEEPKRQALLFNGCIMGTVCAGTNRAAGRVMSRNGIAVDVPAGQGCCGALQVHNGMFEEARRMARANIDAFEAAGDAQIVVTAAGCGSTLKEYAYLLKDDPVYRDRAYAFQMRVKDVTEVLAEEPIVPPGRLDRVVTYQEPCHLAHAQRITRQPRDLIASIPGVTLVEMKESAMCCGSAGIYNILQPEMARELGDRKAANTMATGATEVITANPGCALQLASTLTREGSGVKVKHIVDLLDEAYEAAAND